MRLLRLLRGLSAMPPAYPGVRSCIRSLRAAADALLALLLLRAGAIAGAAAPGRRLLRLAAKVLEQPAAHEDLALLGREVVPELDLVAGVAVAARDQVRAGLELLAQVRERPRLADLRLAVVVVGGERERDDPLRDQVAAVDARERLRDHRLDAELQRGERGVLARGALAVVVAADDEPAAPLLDPLAELRVAVAERELRDRRDVGAVGHDLDAVGREVAGGDVVFLDGRDPALQRLAERLVVGRRLDVRAARDLDLLGLLLVRGREDV